MSTSIAPILFPIFLILIGVFWRRKSSLPLPPGPRKWPLIGNINLPVNSQWIDYARMSKEYGSDILHLQVLGTSTIVLNSWQAANELLGRRSTLYSSRPVATMVNDLMGWDAIITFLPYAEEWRVRRRAFWQEFGPSNTHNHLPVQLKHGRDLLRRLLDEPEEFLHHIRYSLGATIIAITYGFEIQHEGDPNIERADKAIGHLFEAGLPGSYMVDHLPFLKHVPRWMPFTHFLEFGNRARVDTEEMIEVPYTRSCNMIAEGKGHPSLISRMLGKNEQLSPEARLGDHIIQNVASTAYVGGSETTPSALGMFVAAMVLFPEVQLKAQKELDSYLESRLPVFEDRAYLPYVHAVMLESLRWQPVVPLGVAHAVIAEDEYMGYRIPKGSVVYGNTWAILHDETFFPDPEEFKPERFFKDGKTDPQLEEMVDAAFGFGRRMCPGRYMAQNSLWLSIASILATFSISKEADTDVRFFPGFSTRVLPFKCSIKPRSNIAEELIRDAILANE